MATSFNEMMKIDHANMLSSNDFGTPCLNNRTSVIFNIIKTDAFVSISDDGIPITEEKPMFNTLESSDIKQNDILTIDATNYKVRDIRRDGIGGIDIYLKD